MEVATVTLRENSSPEMLTNLRCRLAALRKLALTEGRDVVTERWGWWETTGPCGNLL